MKGLNVQKVFLVVFLVMLFSVGSIVGIGNAADVIKLKFSSPFFDMTSPSQYITYMSDLIEKKTNGVVKIEHFYGGTLGSEPEHPKMVASGTVDMVIVPVSIHAQQFPLNNGQASSLPFDIAKAVAFTNKYRSIPEVRAIMDAEQKEKNVKIFNYNAAGVSGIATKKAVKSMEDLKGLKINTMGPTSRDCWAELGWLNVNVALPDVYESLSRGVIDGGFGAITATLHMKWFETAKTYFCLGANVAEIPIMMNYEKFNSLPADVQEAFIQAANETQEWSIGADKKMTEMAFGAFKAAGCDVVMATPEATRQYCGVSMKYQLAWWRKTCEKMGLGDKAEALMKVWDKMYADALNSN